MGIDSEPRKDRHHLIPKLRRNPSGRRKENPKKSNISRCHNVQSLSDVLGLMEDQPLGEGCRPGGPPLIG